LGLFKNVFGRSDPPKANLDNLFAVPSAAITLEAEAGLRPTGVASVCFRAAEGGAFEAAQTDIVALLDADAGPPVETVNDDYGYTWLVVRRDPGELAELVTDVHAVNSSLENADFGPSLLCSVLAFEGSDSRRLALVYLYKTGTFYPFAPEAGRRRDNALELQVRGVLDEDLAIEPDLTKWLALYEAPGL
jgi:PspA associated protein B